ncbi:MAG TPA: hypothetical protein VJQ54_22070 [Candidatus Sulfotelmatobacter sp.]|nr:hypothetical protein [Candidatus Sulfotelmatobacter sp.]
MLAIAWFWIRVLTLATGIGVVGIGLSSMDRDEQIGLRFLSTGAVILLLGLAAACWPR